MLYAVMGWLIVIDYKTLEILLGGDALFFRVGVGLYTFGIIFMW